ncbi:hypothetical protein [Sphingomonas sp. LY160]|uniref:hypothetical protein n=1 Tax=Sphingomonas sp. LY160 TaxID=3095342 RepID=UPI002ADEF60F|nr:hypothetical protein [Sphingomonas sp. LY160]MEA1072556.1 hypothetical protein [Sphingomonas sp. LY160]
MIALALLSIQAPAMLAPPPEVVVMARRLKDWRGTASANAKGTRCRTVKSTGDADLDRIACDAMRYCMIQLTPDVASAGDKRLTKSEREARMRVIDSRLAQCSEQQHGLRVADMVERRFQRTITQ